MAKGDLVLINFPFTDLSGSKFRPAVILVETILDFTVCFITTQIQWTEITDVPLNPDLNNGLKKESLIRTSKIATLDKSLVKGLLGRLNQKELEQPRLGSCLTNQSRQRFRFKIFCYSIGTWS